MSKEIKVKDDNSQTLPSLDQSLKRNINSEKTVFLSQTVSCCPANSYNLLIINDECFICPSLFQ